MQRFRFGTEVAWPVADHGSHFHLTRLLLAYKGEVRVDVAFLAEGDEIGLHQAGLPQLFCVIEGNGFARGSDGLQVSISRGDAVFWQSGEMHATRTDAGLTALIIQSPELDPSSFLEPA